MLGKRMADRSRWALIGLAVCWFAITASVPGMELQGLYAAQVAVANQDQNERQRGFQLALEQVLVKVSGERALVKRPSIAQALAQPERYVAQFRYRTEIAPAAALGAPPERTLVLWTEFDGPAIDTLLREAGLPVWSRVRPSVLLWFAVERANGPVVLGADNAGDLAKVLKVLRETATQRGLPLILPLLDLEDQSRLSESDLWGGFEEDILKASERYQSEAVLVGKAYRLLTGLWETHWKLLLGGASRGWSLRGEALEPLLEQGIHQAADVLAERFAAAGGPTELNTIELMVGGIHSLDDYASTLAYLQALDPVQAVRVSRVEGDRVWFVVDARGGRAAVREVIALGRKLVPLGVGELLEFELRP